MSKNKEIWGLISVLLQTVVDEAEGKAEEREESPSYQKGELGADLELLKATMGLMRQLIFLQAVESLIQTAYYKPGAGSNNKRVEEALRAFWHVATTLSGME